MKQKTNYTNFTDLFHDAFIDLYKNKSEFFDNRFMNDLMERVESSGLSKDMKKTTYQYILDEWENHFHTNRLSIADALAIKATEICDKNNLKKLMQNPDELSWFSIVDDEFDCSTYDEALQVNDILELLSDKEIEKYGLVKDEDMLTIKTFLDSEYETVEFLEICNFGTTVKTNNPLSRIDSRWYLIAEESDYEDLKTDWNNDISKAIELSKKTYKEFENKKQKQRGQ